MPLEPQKTNPFATANQCFNSLQFLSTPILVAEFKSLVCAKNGFRITLPWDKVPLLRTMYKSNGSSSDPLFAAQTSLSTLSKAASKAFRYNGIQKDIRA